MPPLEEDEEPPLPCRYWSLRRLLQTCSLFGCYLRVRAHLDYCCVGHLDLAQEFSQQNSAFHYFDRFVNSAHRKSLCMLTLLNAVRGLDTGVANLDHVQDLFRTLPWELQILRENAGEWLFFKTPPHLYQTMNSTSQATIRWKGDSRVPICFDGMDHPPITFQQFKMTGGDDYHRYLAINWRLYLFQCGGRSLYCLSSHGSNFAVPEPKVVNPSRKKDPDNPDPSEDPDNPDPSAKIESPQYSHAAAAIGNKMIVAGGESGNGLLDDVQVLNVDSFTWSTVSSKVNLSPSSLPLMIPSWKGHCLVSWGEKVLLVGGKTDPSSDRISVWSFDTESKCWSLMDAKGDIPVSRSGHTVVRASSVLILFGGEDSKKRILNDLHIFDLKSSTWLPLNCTVKVQLSDSAQGTKSPLRVTKRVSNSTPSSGNSENWMGLSVGGDKPAPRFNHAAAAIGNEMIVVGGESGNGLLDDVQVLNFDSFTWSTVSSKVNLSPSSLPLMIPSWKDHCLVSWGKKVLLVGGKTDPISDRVSVWSFDTESECWSLIDAEGDIPVSRNDGHTVVRASSVLILFGGEDSKKGKLNDLHRFDLESSTWLPLNCTGTRPCERSNHVATLFDDKVLQELHSTKGVLAPRKLHVY